MRILNIRNVLNILTTISEQIEMLKRSYLIAKIYWYQFLKKQKTEIMKKAHGWTIKRNLWKTMRPLKFEIVCTEHYFCLSFQNIIILFIITSCNSKLILMVFKSFLTDITQLVLSISNCAKVILY